MEIFKTCFHPKQYSAMYYRIPFSINSKTMLQPFNEITINISSKSIHYYLHQYYSIKTPTITPPPPVFFASSVDNRHITRYTVASAAPSNKMKGILFLYSNPHTGRRKFPHCFQSAHNVITSKLNITWP